MDKKSYKLLKLIARHGFIPDSEFFQLIDAKPDNFQFNMTYQTLKPYLRTEKNGFRIRPEGLGYIENRRSDNFYKISTFVFAAVTAFATLATFIIAL